MGLATLLPVLGFGLMFARVLEMRQSVALLHALPAIVLTLYVGGLAGMLWWTALALHIAGLALLGYEVWRLSQVRDRIDVPLPLAVLVVCTVLFALVHGNDLYVYYDEYSHWGVYVKEMLSHHGFWTADTNSMHPRYPPGAPLWQYFFNVFRAPSDGIAYIAQFVLLLTPLLVLFEKIEWRRAYWVPFIAVLCVLVLANFGLGISSLYVDHVIGAWFFGIVACFVLDAPGGYKRYAFVLPLTLLALVKGSSLEFALAAAAIIATLAVIRARSELSEWLPAARHGLSLFVAVAVSALLALQVWGWHLDRIGAPQDLEAVGGIVSGLSGEIEVVDAEQGAEITRRFIEVFVGQQLSRDGVSSQFNAFSYSIRDLFTDSWRISTLGLFVAYTLWWAGLSLLLLRGAERLQWTLVAAGVGLTGVAYIFALYLTYRYSAGEYGLVMSSYMRYVHTIALPMVLVSFAPLLPAFRNSAAAPVVSLSGRLLPVPSVLALAAFLALYYFETPYLRPVYEPHATVPLRQQLEPLATDIHSRAGESSVWVYLPNDYPNGFLGQLMQYLLAPTPATIERDTSFLDRSSAEVLREWSAFDYVWLAGELETDQARRFSELAGYPLTARLFAVTVDATGHVRLSPVDIST